MSDSSPQPQPETSMQSRIVLIFTCLVAIAVLQYQPIVATLQALMPRSVLGRDSRRPQEQLPAIHANSTERETAVRNVRPSFGWERDAHHPRYRLLAAMVGLLDYKETMELGLKKKMNGFHRLNSWQKKLLAPVRYADKLAVTSELIKTNDVTAQKVLDYGLAYYNVDFADLRAFRAAHRNDSRPVADHTSVVQSLKHFVRDWSADGAHERSVTFPPILHLLRPGDPSTSTSADTDAPRVRKRVLVPGAGLGRLAYELAAAHHEVVANEYSYYQILALRYMLSLSSSPASPLGNVNVDVVAKHIFHSNINWWSHQKSTAGLQHASKFPEICPAIDAVDRVRIVDGDFVTSFFGAEQTFDVVVTLFFIDTARNLIDYLDKIHAALKPGGTWVNLGPLLYGTGPWVELSLDEVLIVVENLGFELQTLDDKWGEDTFPGIEKWRGKVRGKMAGYSWDTESLSRNAYQAQLWVATKT